MDLKGLKELERISQEVGKHPDFVQGGVGTHLPSWMIDTWR